MIVEVLVAATFATTGILVLAPFSRRLPHMAIALLAFPIGATVYAVVALGWVILFDALDPAAVLGATFALSLGRFAVGILMGGVDRRLWRLGATAVLAAVSVAVVFSALHLSRLTIDSIRYLLASIDVQDAITDVHRTDLLKRQFALPVWQALAGLGDGRYMATIGPLFGISGTAFFGWFLWTRGGGGLRWRRWVVLGAVGLALTSNRFLFDFFYLNTHVQVSVLTFVGVCGLWLAVVEDQAWAHPAGLALAGTLMLRPESPLVVALVLVLFAAERSGLEARAAAVLPTIAVTVGWWGMVLWSNTPGGSDIGLDAPVFMSLVGLVGASGLVVFGWGHLGARVTGLAGRLVVPALAVGLVGLAALEPANLGRSVKVAALNVGWQGLWIFTWTVLVPLLVVALVAQGFDKPRLWFGSVVGFGIIFFLTPLLRGVPWRLGTGDSGNRMLAHILLVAIAAVVMAARAGSRVADEG